MKHPVRLCLAALAFTLVALLASTPARAAVQTYGTLLSYDFDTNAWPGASPEAVGTIDTLGSAQASLGLRSPSLITSGPLPLSITETNLGKLTLAFSLSASSARPVTLTLQSYDSTKTRTGGLQTLVYPAAPNFYQRYAVDLSTCQPTGTGTFQPNAPYVSFSFSTQDASWQGVSSPEIRVDNVNYALPAYYVSTTGKNSNTGRSEAQAFLTPQQALNVAQAGDIIDVMSGTYIDPNGPTPSAIFPNAVASSGGLGSVAVFQRTGTPANWIVLKNYPGQTPTFFSNGWDIINLSQGYNGHPFSAPLSYLEVRGLHIRGEGDVVATKYPDSVGQVDSRSNSNGISAAGDNMTVKPHHLRLADNLVEYCPGAGLGSGQADWVQIENNTSRNNSWTTIYATSGISLSGTFNFDATDNVYKQLIRNNVCSGNQTYQMWKSQGLYSDGNGIIMDVNHTSTAAYIGRTLVQSNLCYNNGGGGVHAYGANRVDMINNTAYLNSASVHLEYAQIDANSGDNDNIFNNILVAPVAAAGQPAEPVNGNYNCTNLIYSHNLYFGGNTAPVMGTGDVIADPRFVTPSIDPTTANFHLQTISPALATGIVQTFSPFLDLDGRPRSLTAPDKGVYQLLTILSGTVSLQAWQGTPQTLIFTLTPTGTTAGSVVTQTLIPAANGAFTLSGILPGTYTLSVKGALWLRQAQAVDTTMGSVSGLVFALPGGDANNDNRVSIADYNALSAAYGTRTGSPGYNPVADFNGDGRVSIADYNILSSNYGLRGTP